MACQLVRSSHTASKKINLKGIFGALTTPFDLQENIAYDKLKLNLSKYEKTPLLGYVVAGSTGEAPSLSPQERVDLVKSVRQSVASDKLIIGNATNESTRVACELCETLAAAGADGVMVMIPFYYKKQMTDDIIVEHFTTIADRSPIPIVVYNGSASGGDLSVPLLIRLAAHPNIVAVKDGDIRRITCVVEEVKKKKLDFEVLVSGAGYLLPAIQSGSCGALIALPSVLSQDVCDLYSLIHQKNWEKAIELSNRISNVDHLLDFKFGVSSLKVAMDLLGFYGGPCRKPLVNPSPSEVDEIKSTLIEQGFLKK